MIDLKDWLKLEEEGLQACANKKYVRAETAFLEAVKILEEQEKNLALDTDPSIKQNMKTKMALSLNNLGATYQLQGKYGLALNEYIKSTEIYRKLHGENSMEFATSLHNLGMVCAAKQDFQQAEALFRRSLSIKETLLSATHPELQAIKANLTKVLTLSGQRKKPDNNSAQAN